MATKTLCKGVLCISPVCFLLFTFYVLFVAKKDGKRTGSVVGASVKNSQRKHLVECASNFYPGNPSGHAAACSPCPVGHFSFRGWIACIPYIDCSNIALNVRIRRRIGTPGRLNAVKKIYLADWFGYDVVLVKCAHKMFEEDCLHGMRMTEGLQGSQLVVQLIGICYESLEVRIRFRLVVDQMGSNCRTPCHSEALPRNAGYVDTQSGILSALSELATTQAL